MERQKCNTCGQAIALEASLGSEDRTPPCATSLTASRVGLGTDGLGVIASLLLQRDLGLWNHVDLAFIPKRPWAVGGGTWGSKRGKGKESLEGVLSSGLTLWVTWGCSSGRTSSESLQPRGEGAGVLILQLPPTRGSELLPGVWGVNSPAHWPALLQGLSRLHWSEKNLAPRLVWVCS